MPQFGNIRSNRIRCSPWECRYGRLVSPYRPRHRVFVLFSLWFFVCEVKPNLLFSRLNLHFGIHRVMSALIYPLRSYANA